MFQMILVLLVLLVGCADKSDRLMIDASTDEIVIDADEDASAVFTIGEEKEYECITRVILDVVITDEDIETVSCSDYVVGCPDYLVESEMTVSKKTLEQLSKEGRLMIRKQLNTTTCSEKGGKNV
jgi:hypothetical protein